VKHKSSSIPVCHNLGNDLSLRLKCTVKVTSLEQINSQFMTKNTFTKLGKLKKYVQGKTTLKHCAL